MPQYVSAMSGGLGDGRTWTLECHTSRRGHAGPPELSGGSAALSGIGNRTGFRLIYDGAIIPMELGHLSYKDSTYEIM